MTAWQWKQQNVTDISTGRTMQGLLSCSSYFIAALTPLSPKCSTNELPPVSTSAVKTTTGKQTHSYFLQVHWTLHRTDARDTCVGVAHCVIKQEQKDEFWEISEKFLRLLAANELGEDRSRRKTQEWSWQKHISGAKWRNISRAENQECKYWSSIPPRPHSIPHKAQTFSFPST